MSVHALDACLAQHLPVLPSRQEWELLFASVRTRLETVAEAPQEAEPAEAMTRIRADVLECAEALRKLQILLAPAGAGRRYTD
jgi:hypothetical protein